LQPADFVVRENGVRQAIDTFECVSVVPERDAFEFPGASGVESEVASNAPPPADSRAFAIVIDEMSLDSSDLVRVQRVVNELMSNLASSDRIALTYIARSDLGQDFTTKRERITRAAGGFGAAIGGPNDFRDVAFVLTNVVRTLTTVPQARRAVILISRGWQADITNDYLRDMLRSSQQLGIPIYTLDPDGLVAPALGLEGHLEDQTPENRRRIDQRRKRQQQFLLTLSENTGGRGFVNRSNVMDAVRQIVADNSHFCIIGYRPTKYSADGRFHRVDVTVTRPGVHVRARPGYIASRPGRTSMRARLDDALSAGLAVGSLPTSAVATFLERDGDRTRVLLTLDISYSGLATQSLARDEVEVTWLAVDADGRTRASGEQSLPVKVTDDDRTAFTLSVHDALTLPNERLTLRIAVFSRFQNSIGAVHLPLDLGEGAPRSLLLAVTDDDRMHVVTRGALPAKLFSFPLTRRTFGRREQLHVLARLDGPALTEDNVRLTLIARDGTRRSIPTRLGSVDGERDLSSVQSSIELESLVVGRYLLELSVAEPHGTRLSHVEFEVK
jgi:VWFA-related protein